MSSTPPTPSKSQDHNADSPYTELVIVCCHSTYIGYGDAPDESQWILQDFQKSDEATGKPSEHHTFITHIMAAAEICLSRPQALLCFSGGQTTDSQITEAESYLIVAHILAKSGKLPREVLPRIDTEKDATDSYQNLLFSIIRFRRLVGRYPHSITVITHTFKERRFLELHASAIKWPKAKIRVLGVNPPFTLEELEQTREGEFERAYRLFAEDPYGVRSPLAEKRVARKWEPETLEFLDVPEDVVNRLLAWQGGTSGQEIFQEDLPWENVVAEG
jgi:hypothetical protein